MEGYCENACVFEIACINQSSYIIYALVTCSYTSEFFHVLYYKIVSCSGPSRNGLIAAVDHVIGFCLCEERAITVREHRSIFIPLFHPHGGVNADAIWIVHCTCRKLLSS
jgi:hypothetical protein